METKSVAAQRAALFDALLVETSGLLHEVPTDGLVAMRSFGRADGEASTAVRVQVVSERAVSIMLENLDPPTALRIAKLLGEVLP